ncbi:MAG: hypothetical protein ACREQR_00235 [Candidatus Binataceae bacterium]
MNELYEVLTQLIEMNGGSIVGKTRLQKTVYLLDQCGLNSGCAYDYHYYGPFSVQIAEAAEDARDLRLLSYDERNGYHAVPYGVYTTHTEIPLPEKIGDLTREEIAQKLAIMNGHSAIDLELAATLLFLQNSGSQNPREEIKLLKPAKATPEGIRSAERLLTEIGAST